MKSVFVLLFVAFAGALPQQYRGQYSGPQDQSGVQIQKVEVYEVPYQPSASFYLFGQQQSAPGGFRPSQPAPPAVYGPPPQEYGPPTDVPTTTEAFDVTTTESTITTTEAATNGTDEANSAQLKDGEEEKGTEQGVYYVYHPEGLLQRVMYATKDDARNMAYTAQLKYSNVEPIRDPIYTYDPQTFVFQRLQL